MLGNAMFYGRGAGKLPTASAVVADVVEEVETFVHTNIKMNWSSSKSCIFPICRKPATVFFVRVSGAMEQQKDKVCALFGQARFVQVVDGEFGFVTEVMEEKVFDEKAAQLDGVLTRIRGSF